MKHKRRLALTIPSYVDEGAVRSKPPRLAPLTREEFVSKKLAPKLSQQLKVRLPPAYLLSALFAALRNSLDPYSLLYISTVLQVSEV